MQPSEALNSAINSWVGGNCDWRSGEEVAANLRTLGFTVVPITPTEERVEAVARAISGSYGMGRVLRWEKGARAAYAAAIGEAGCG